MQRLCALALAACSGGSEGVDDGERTDPYYPVSGFFVIDFADGDQGVCSVVGDVLRRCLE